MPPTCSKRCQPNCPQDHGGGTCYSKYIALDLAYAIPGIAIGGLLGPPGAPRSLAMLAFQGAASYVVIRHIVLPTSGAKARLLLNPASLIGFGAGFYAAQSVNAGGAASLFFGLAAAALYSEIQFQAQGDYAATTWRIFANDRDMLSAGFDGTPALTRNRRSLHQKP